MINPKLAGPKPVLNILVFDEDLVAARKVQNIFVLSGNEVVCCDTYDEFSDHLENGLFDIAIFDLNENSDEGSIHAISVYNWSASIKQQKDDILFVLYTDANTEKYTEEITTNKLKIIPKLTIGIELLSRVTILFSFPEHVLTHWMNEYNQNIKTMSNNVVSLHSFIKKT